ncbi:WXG100 family type VII secretion target [Paenibacillus barcinonensis]|uniref:WXG100 family type VII secretion target n=1 Tax=Paenibacillus barcinonensis TaxID=198119 RepID=UPI001C10F586|nr:WXG100 family type VII secretion target [Paenibacillus barcinonensis]MBU5353349.1 WXG100 family type VII secretion target [Paenibacillus barcinonensis]
MLRIQVHPDELEAKARLVQQCKLELDRIVRELDKSIYFLQSEWSGATREQFFWDFMEVKDVFPATLGKLDEIQKEFTFIANNFRTTDSTGEVALYIPDELKPSFFTGAVDKAIGDTVTGLGEMAEAILYHPFSTIGNLAYDMTLGKLVDARRGIAFAWDAAWGTGTARSDIEQFVDEQKKQLNEDESGYYKGALVGQALSYFFFGRALHSKGDYGAGGGGGGKKETEQGSGRKGNASTVQKQKEIIKSYKHLSDFEKNTLMQRARDGVISPEKWTGTISGVKEFKNVDEFKIADRWLREGKNVEKLADVKGKDGNLVPGADFNVDEVIIEAKTAKSKNINTTSKKAIEAINRQGENVVIDGREIGYTVEDAKRIIEIINRKTGGKGNTEIWINDGSIIKN